MLEAPARSVPITTPKGEFQVWTRRLGDHPTVKVLLLHGGPGMTHEAFENFTDHLSATDCELYFYDQLGSHLSDRPDEPSLWTVERFVEEVEQVRTALGLGPENFFLLGQSWGGLLAMEYALKYQRALKGLVISNMMSSIPAYNRYADQVLAPRLDPQVLAEIRALEAAEAFDDPRYEQLVQDHFYTEHVLRRPMDQWPEAVLRTLEHANLDIYVRMQGPSEFGARGLLEFWDRSADLGRIKVPTLVIGAEHDTMDPSHLRWMAGQVARGRYLHCPQGSHLAQYDDPEPYFAGLKRFLSDVDAGTF